MSETKLFQRVRGDGSIDLINTPSLESMNIANEENPEDKVVKRFYDLFTNYSNRELLNDKNLLQFLNQTGILKKVFLKMAENYYYSRIPLEYIDAEIVTRCMLHSYTVAQLFLRFLQDSQPKSNSDISQKEIDTFSKFTDLANVVFKSPRYYLELAKLGKQDILYLIHETFEAIKRSTHLDLDVSPYPYSNKRYWDIVSQNSNINNKMRYIPDIFKSKELYLNIVKNSKNVQSDFEEIPTGFIDFKIAQAAFDNNVWVYKQIPSEYKTQEMSDKFWADSGYNKIEIFGCIPKRFHTVEMLEEILFKQSDVDILEKWKISFEIIGWKELIQKNGLDKMIRYLSCFLLRRTLRSIVIKNKEVKISDNVFGDFEAIISLLESAGVEFNTMGFLFGDVHESGGYVTTKPAVVVDLANTLLQKNLVSQMVWEVGRYFILNTHLYEEVRYSNTLYFKLKKGSSRLYFDPLTLKFYTGDQASSLVANTLNQVLFTFFEKNINQINVEKMVENTSESLKSILSMKEES